MNQLTIEEKYSLNQNCINAILLIEPDFEKPDFDHNKMSLDHPIWSLIGSTPRSSILGELGEALQNLKNVENFSIIIERLKDSRQFNGAYNEFQIGNSLFKHGISFKINRLQNTKLPDFMIILNNREINLEVTEKERSQDYIKAEKNAKRITENLFEGLVSGKFHYSVMIYRPLSDKRAQEIFEKCQLMKEKTQNSGFEEYHIQGVIDLYIYKPEFIEKVPVDKRRIFYTLPQNDEVPRIKTKIKKKSSQLDNTRPGILLIIDNYSWLFNIGQKGNPDLKSKLEEYICDFENISALLIQNHYVIPDYFHNESEIVDDNSILIETYNSKTLFTTNKLILLNEYAKNPLLENEIDLLKRI
jgi:hypothetical protein